MFKFIILAATFGLGFYVGVMNANSRVVQKGPALIGVIIDTALDEAEAKQKTPLTLLNKKGTVVYK
jgi:hypothetical protein